MKRLDLLKYAHKRVSSLSGGNKRKLCTALSVMAPVPVVLMDEPTRYFAKRFIIKRLFLSVSFSLFFFFF